ncbi:S-adenosyl-L-methionine-dependent methyltransferase [Backusella circina FSU 941]|nr:S-adenosyl-L-methionine-dependent methyltransferase [Backusella circina FSU 941]
MGLWEMPHATFPEACEHLVKTVVKGMHLNRESDVLDVGFGCGDSCILLSEKYGCNITGITNELSQYDIATSRITTHNIQLIHGSADHLSTLLPHNKKYTHVISIDSAYHYNTRSSFFKQVHDECLQAGGTLGLFDLVIAKEYKNRTVTDVLCRLLHIPKANVVTVEEYHAQLVEAGFTGVEVQALERAQVFGGLAAFLERRREAFGNELSMGNRLFLIITGWMFAKLATGPWVVPVLVKADKSK